MKIAWIVPGFSSDEQDWCIPALLDLARVMAARHELHVFALRYPYRDDRYKIFDTVVHAIGGAHGGKWSAARAWRVMLKRVANEHQRAPFDVLHAFWVWEPGVIAVWLKRRLDIRTLISVAGGELINLSHINYGRGGNWLYRQAMRWALRRAQVVTVGSQGLLERIRTETSRVTFAPLGVDLDLFAPAESRHLEMPQTGSHILVNVGSLQAVKGQSDLLRALRLVVDQQTNVKLKIIGEGLLRGDLESLARKLKLTDHVDFVGGVRRELLPAIYQEATLFVQTSLHEAQGMALLEAAACGLPIVGTAVGALADLAPDAALASPCGDPVRLAQAIISLLDDQAYRRTLGASARTRIEEQYELLATMHRFESLYK